MIAMLRGTLAAKQPDEALIDVGGVGYQVFIPLSTYSSLPQVGEATQLLIHTYLREEALHLYGFGRPEEKRLFELLIGVTGIGVKLALASLSAMSPEELAHALAQEDLTRLSRISGVGRRTAQRMVMELKEKVGALGLAPPPGSAVAAAPGTRRVAAAPAPLAEELTSALVNLGYRKPQVEPVVRQVLAEGHDDIGTGLRAALQLLSSS